MRFGALQLPHLSLYQGGLVQGTHVVLAAPPLHKTVEISKLIAVESLRQHPCLSVL